jgi:SAM-dependent methyltransferase
MSAKVMVREAVRRITPWWAKCALKLAMVKFPLGYSMLRTLALARHGGMEDPAWAFATFHRHFDRVGVRNKPGGGGGDGRGFTVLELGPGDSLFSAVIARAYGAASVTLLDVGYFANTDVRLYRNMAAFLRGKGLDAPDLASANTLDDVLAACNARYECDGLRSLRRLPDAGFDFVFSNGVLQHVWRNDVPETLQHLRRIVHPRGATIHSLDLRDTMGQSLNHLRFDESIWESDWFRSAGFYTNRLRVSELLRLAREAGFEPELDEVNRWPAIPMRRSRLHRTYRAMSDEDLLVATIRLILRPAGAPADGEMLSSPGGEEATEAAAA